MPLWSGPWRIPPYHHPPTNKSAMDWVVYSHRIRTPNQFAATKGNPHTPVKYHEKSLSQQSANPNHPWSVTCRSLYSALPPVQLCAENVVAPAPRAVSRIARSSWWRTRRDWWGTAKVDRLWDSTGTRFWGSNRWCCKEDEPKVPGSQNTSTQLVENFYGWTYITHRIRLSVGSEPSTWETKSSCSSGGSCCSTFMCHHS